MVVEFLPVTKFNLMDMSDGENNPCYYTRSQAARAKNQNMDDNIVPEDSASQVNDSARRPSSRVSSAFSSHSTSARSKEQLDLDISALAIKMDSQQRRAQLEKKKLDVELEMGKKKFDVELEMKKQKLDIELQMEKNNLQEEMDLATNERESLDHECSDSSLVDITTVRIPEQIGNPLNEEIQKMLKECYTFIDDCCTYLGSGKVDLNGKKARRVYMPPDKNVNRTEPLQKSIESEKTKPRSIPALKIPRTSTVKKETEKLAKHVEPISVCPQKDETEPRIVTVTRRLPETPIVTRHPQRFLKKSHR